MNYYQFHLSDWALHTSHLSLEEEAVYRRLLDFYYDTEKPIPKKTQSVIRRLRLGSYEETVGLILEEFFTLEADGWHNLRADFEIKEYHKKADRARSNGKKGGRPKKNQGLETQLVSVANPEKTGSKANQEPRTINQEPVTKNHKSNTRSSLDFSAWPQTPAPEVLADYKKLRQSKKAPLTQTVVSRMTKELTELNAKGITVDQALGVACEKGWQGLKAEWVVNHLNGQPRNFGQESVAEFNRREAEEWLNE